ncbi:hypothetical protein CKAH01_05362 [Colletotrichum kahawae]|uniref:Uncharacterized protein n=1 Tax=Colletotrichum kahawae TaxID=34407 RepID=A0AAE0D6T1_COLKA|nr:hypothetical protein CKAH01_05362 [Colletotrichum kahawae]
MSSQAPAVSGTICAAENTIDLDHYTERPRCHCPLVSESSIDINRDRGLFMMEKDLSDVHHLGCKIKDLEWTLEKTLRLHDETTSTTLRAIEHISTQLSGPFSASLYPEIKRLEAIVLKPQDETQATTVKISFATDMGFCIEKRANPLRSDYPMQHAFEIPVRDVHECKIVLHE